jgi:hypothetical protein
MSIIFSDVARGDAVATQSPFENARARFETQ